MQELQFTFRARRDIFGIGEFISRDSPVQAIRFIAKLEEHCWLLASRPLIGRPRNDLASGLRSISFGKYVIFFRPISGGAEIMRVIHSARDLRQAFNEPN